MPTLSHAADTNANWIGPSVVAALTDAGFDVISFAARGHGRSEKPDDHLAAVMHPAFSAALVAFLKCV